MEYDLGQPIKVNGQEIRKVTLRRPTGLDFEILDNIHGENKRKSRLIANCAGITPEAAGDLDLYDWNQIFSFIEDCLKKKPSEMTRVDS